MAYITRGAADGAKGEDDQVIADCTAAIRLQPDCAEAYFNRGISYAAKCEYDKAIADYTAAIQLQPDDAQR